MRMCDVEDKTLDLIYWSDQTLSTVLLESLPLVENEALVGRCSHWMLTALKDHTFFLLDQK